MKMILPIRPAVALSIILLVLASIALSQNNPPNPAVEKRIAVMMQADAALRRLTAMTTGGAMFDRDQVSRDRRTLIRTTRAIPGLFRHPQTEAPSRASYGIWHRWDEFRARAKRATTAARRLNTRSPKALQPGLSEIIRTCLDCHDQFRLKAKVK